MQPRQLSLNVRLNDEATFDNFWVKPGSTNAQVLRDLQAFSAGQLAETFLYLWGSQGSGRSHLLQASCHQVLLSGGRSQYLPLEELAGEELAGDELAGLSPDAVLEGLDEMDLLCLDQIDAVLGLAGWEEALFHLYNRLRERGGRLLISAPCGPQELKTSLADLHSRLAWGVVYRLEALEDPEKAQALQWRARKRGMEMSDEVAQFILKRSSRSPEALFACLEQLDRLSLVEKRRLTIPFIKRILL